MAYMSQEKKKGIEAVVKGICRRHGVKATLAVRHHSTLVLNIASGSIPFFDERAPVRVPEHLAADHEKWRAHAKATGHMDVHRAEEFAEGTSARAFFDEVFPALNDGNHDRSDLMTDYFDVGWYVDVNVGRWNKPYVLTSAPKPPEPPKPAKPEPVPSPRAEHDARAAAFAKYVAARETAESLAAANEAMTSGTKRITVTPALYVQKAAREYVRIDVSRPATARA